MKSGPCQRESQVEAALRSGKWSLELRAHVEQCECCRDTVLVAEFLRQQLSLDEGGTLPSADAVWCRAQVKARRADAERALHPVLLVQRISAVCALVGLTLLTLRFASEILRWLQHLPAGAEEPLAGLFLVSAIAFVAAVSAGLACMRYASK